MFNSDSDIVQCPYNKHHTVPRLKFQRHLVKCEKVTMNFMNYIHAVFMRRTHIDITRKFL